MAEGYECIGYDIEAHEYDGERYPGTLVLADVLTLDGAQLAHADLIVASPPCQEFSYMAMPWSRAKQIARALRGDGDFPESYKGSRTLADLTALFNACFRIQREASEAAGRHIPMVLENVKGAQPWVGRARANYGSFYFWGDVPALMPRPTRDAVKVPGMDWSQFGAPGYKAIAFNGEAVRQTGRKVPSFRFGGSGGSFQTAAVDGMKNTGGSWFAIGSPGQKVTGKNPVHASVAEGRKGAGAGAEWFDGNLCKLSSKSNARKAASARIAKIPLALSSWIGRTYRPDEAAA